MKFHLHLQLLKGAGLVVLLSTDLACSGPASSNKNDVPIKASSPDTSSRQTTVKSSENPKEDSVHCMCLLTPDLLTLFFMNGKYLTKEKLLDDNELNPRLNDLIGPERFQFMRDTWKVDEPITVKDSIFTAKGCMQHNCGSTNFIIVADLKRDKIYVGIREDEKVKTWSEDTVQMPQILAWRTPQPD